jgi:hypothetical protein
VGPQAQALAVGIEARRARLRADPLARYRCASWAQVELLRALSADPPVETLWGAGNNGAKTTGGIATDLAFLQGRDTLMDWDGSEIRLPVIAPPVSWVLGVPSYKIAAGSSLVKLRELLGTWPFHEAHAGGPDQVTTFSIKHRATDDNMANWSKLYVFPYEGEVPEALRLDGWHCDEPPPMRFLDALRNRKKAGRPLRGFLTLTPIERRAWQPIFADFPREHRRVSGGRLRLQSSVYENRALSPADIAAAEAAVRTSPYRQARLYGDPVDISGTCPFDGEELARMRDGATDGLPYAVEMALRDGREVAAVKRHERGQMESWGWPEAGDRAIIVADPSSGIRDPDKSDAQQPRNPSGLVMCSVAERKLLLRFNGYVRAHELGVMARAVANRCASWVMVHETNGGWGDAFLRGFRETPAITRGELWFEVDPMTGKPVADPGWNQTATRRGMLLSALQHALEHGGLTIPSRACLDNLLQVRLDANERWDHGDGRGPHGEDVITLGISAYVMGRSTLPRIRREVEPASKHFARLTGSNGHARGGAIERW